MLKYQGIEYYDTLERCLQDGLSVPDFEAKGELKAKRSIGRRIIDSDGIGPVVLVEIKNGLTPVHVRSVQALASW